VRITFKWVKRRTIVAAIDDATAAVTKLTTAVVALETAIANQTGVPSAAVETIATETSALADRVTAVLPKIA